MSQYRIKETMKRTGEVDYGGVPSTYEEALAECARQDKRFPFETHEPILVEDIPDRDEGQYRAGIV